MRQHKSEPQQQHEGQTFVPSLCIEVLVEVLRRVQGFDSGLAEARVVHLQHMLPQLQQQLRQLAAAMKPQTQAEHEQRLPTSDTSSSSISSS